MLAHAFIPQIYQRFFHKKRVRVCLWSDPAAEFSRLLPVFSQPPESQITDIDMGVEDGRWMRMARP